MGVGVREFRGDEHGIPRWRETSNPAVAGNVEGERGMKWSWEQGEERRF
jgi:hypothetical protein